MKKYIDPFLINLPTIDLHGYDKVSSIIKVDEFINDSLKLKKYKIVIIHGKGKGVLKEEIHKYLKKDKRVLRYYLDINIGTTIVELESSKR